MSRHTHHWCLAEYKPAKLVPMDENVQGYVPAYSLWLCDCGKSKTVDVVEEDK